jgi:hypothetical protein
MQVSPGKVGLAEFDGDPPPAQDGQFKKRSYSKARR